MEKVATKADFEELVAKGPVLVDFMAEWCMPCKMMAPLLEEMSKKFEGKIKIVSVDVDEGARIAAPFGITGVPTFLFFKNGQKMKSLIGSQRKVEMEKEITDFLAGTAEKPVEPPPLPEEKETDASML